MDSIIQKNDLFLEKYNIPKEILSMKDNVKPSNLILRTNTNVNSSNVVNSGDIKKPNIENNEKKISSTSKILIISGIVLIVGVIIFIIVYFTVISKRNEGKNKFGNIQLFNKNTGVSSTKFTNGDTLTIRYEHVENMFQGNVQWLLSTDNGVTYNNIIPTVESSSNTVTYTIPDLIFSDGCIIKLLDVDNPKDYVLSNIFSVEPTFTFLSGVGVMNEGDHIFVNQQTNVYLILDSSLSILNRVTSWELKTSIDKDDWDSSVITQTINQVDTSAYPDVKITWSSTTSQNNVFYKISTTSLVLQGYPYELSIISPYSINIFDSNPDPSPNPTIVPTITPSITPSIGPNTDFKIFEVDVNHTNNTNSEDAFYVGEDVIVSFVYTGSYDPKKNVTTGSYSIDDGQTYTEFPITFSAEFTDLGRAIGIFHSLPKASDNFTVKISVVDDDNKTVSSTSLDIQVLSVKLIRVFMLDNNNVKAGNYIPGDNVTLNFECLGTFNRSLFDSNIFSYSIDEGKTFNNIISNSSSWSIINDVYSIQWTIPLTMFTKTFTLKVTILDNSLESMNYVIQPIVVSDLKDSSSLISFPDDVPLPHIITTNLQIYPNNTNYKTWKIKSLDTITNQMTLGYPIINTTILNSTNIQLQWIIPNTLVTYTSPQTFYFVSGELTVLAIQTQSKDITVLKKPYTLSIAPIKSLSNAFDTPNACQNLYVTGYPNTDPTISWWEIALPTMTDCKNYANNSATVPQWYKFNNNVCLFSDAAITGPDYENTCWKLGVDSNDKKQIQLTRPTDKTNSQILITETDTTNKTYTFAVDAFCVQIGGNYGVPFSTVAPENNSCLLQGSTSTMFQWNV